MILPSQPPWHGATLGGAWTALGLVVIAYCLFGEPLLGRWIHSRFLERVRLSPSARSRHYLLLISFEIAMGAVALLLIAIIPGISFARAGLRLPFADPTGFLTGAMTSCAIAIVPLAALITILQRQGKFPMPPGGAAVDAMLPRLKGERAMFVLLSLCAGIFEEIAYRGLLLAIISAIGPVLPALAVIVIGAALFAVAHAYQGIAGALLAGLLGFALGGIYFVTGSLILSVVFHTVLDARQAFTLPGPTRDEQSAGVAQ